MRKVYYRWIARQFRALPLSYHEAFLSYWTCVAEPMSLKFWSSKFQQKFKKALDKQSKV